MITTNLADFGTMEIEMTEELLKAKRTQGFPKDFCNDEVTIMMDKGSGNVCFTNSDLQVAMMNGDTLEMFYTCPQCGHKDFLEDMGHGENNDDCQEYLNDIGYAYKEKVLVDGTQDTSIQKEVTSIEDTQVADTSGMGDNIQNAGSLLSTKVLEGAYIVIDLETGNEVVKCNVYGCRDQRYSTTYSIIGVRNRNGTTTGSGKGTAGGGGYHLASAAVAYAIDSAGIKMNQGVDGRGDYAITEALEAIAKAEGCTRYKLIQVNG